MSDQVLCERDARGRAIVTLNRPEKHNAFDDRTILALTEALRGLAADSTVRVVVLTGSGKSFSSGADLDWMQSMIRYDERENVEDALKLAALLELLDTLEKPTIAEINGPAFGGGVGLVACCDIAIASTAARFALTEVRLGLVPAVISPFVIAAIGVRNARRLFLTGEVLDAQMAQSVGLVHQAVAPEELNLAVEAQVRMLLDGGPSAQREAKTLIADIAAARESRAALSRRTAQLIARLRVSPEGQEGLGAFLHKRKPAWRT